MTIAHLEEAGESYLQHMSFAFRFAAGCFAAGFAAAMHGLLPWVFPTRASQTVLALADRVRARRPPTREERSAAR